MLYPGSLRQIVVGLARIRNEPVPLLGGDDRKELPRTRQERQLSLSYLNVSTARYGSGPAIIFRPEGVRSDHGTRYMVEVGGVWRRDGQPAELRYLVEFVEVPRGGSGP